MRILRYVGRKGCSDDDYRAAVRMQNLAIVDTLPGGPNTTVRFRLDGKPLQVDLTKDVRDFLDLAVAVYIADEIGPRQQSRDGWTRVFDVLFPVANPRRWAAATEGLSQCLRVLSGDEFSFAWPKRRKLPSLGQHHTLMPEGFDTVCLFSGGLDSLLGAYQLLSAGKKVLLVGHQAEPVTASAQTTLAAGLRDMFPDSVALIQSRVGRSRCFTPRYELPPKREETHRTRSLLFLAIAAAVASAAPVDEIVIAENGLIAINPPLQPSRLGSLSTRTAHPAFLVRLLDVLDNLGVFKGKLANPFLYLSKTDMLRSLPAELAGLAQRSVSCARPSRFQDRGVRHCGYCVPCIYRRVAMMAAGLDDREHYAFNVFADLAHLSPHKQADFRALVSFAKRVVCASPLERDMMVLAHGNFASHLGGRIGPAPAQDYTPWSQMLTRWSQDFLAVVDALASRSTKRIVLPAGRKRRR